MLRSIALMSAMRWGDVICNARFDYELLAYLLVDKLLVEYSAEVQLNGRNGVRRYAGIGRDVGVYGVAIGICEAVVFGPGGLLLALIEWLVAESFDGNESST